MKIIKKFLFFGLFLLIIILGLSFAWQYGGKTIEINNLSEEIERDIKYSANPLSGAECPNYNRRPMAVVLAADPATRPLAGISEADFIFEMPVITNSITRMVAIYVCGEPKEIGSLRSARHDFIPLTMGLDAILVHWGGSHFALDKLDAGIMENIDALKNPHNAFYQKNEIPQPHNGFTSSKRLANSAKKLGYRMEGEFEGYIFQEISNDKIQIIPPVSGQKLTIDYSYPYNVEYQYEPKTNSYLRWRNDKPEIDKNNNQQVAAKNIVIMRTISRQIEGPDYNDLDIEGRGECQVYQNGSVISCIWSKDKTNLKSKLYFLNEDGQEIKFTPGQVWIEIVEMEQEVSWK